MVAMCWCTGEHDSRGHWEYDNTNFGNCIIFKDSFYGVSRSASVIIAFLMQKYRLDYDQVFERVKEKRTSIGPNAGFVQQLKLFKLMDWMIDTDNKLYKTYMLRLAAVNIQKSM